MTSDREERIKQLAQSIWESEGRPTGQEVRHWYMAVKLVEASERPDPYAGPAPDAPPVPEETDLGADEATGQGESPPAESGRVQPGKKTGTAGTSKGGTRKAGTRKTPDKPTPN